MAKITVIGGGLAGAEAAWQAAEAGIEVTLYEMRPKVKTHVHQGESFAELVCSNSFRSDDKEHNAVGLLHEEMRMLNSLIMEAADKHKLPAGGALAVDRDGFSAYVSAKLAAHPSITILREEVTALPEAEAGLAIIATGPLTSEALSQDILQKTGQDNLAFYDAIAPIVYKESINMDVAWMQSRYDKAGPGGTGADYINCPMNKAQYMAFIEALLDADKTAFKDFEQDAPFFDGCLPIEVMASRGVETLRFGPMKPVGLTNPHKTEDELYAVVQLRQDNHLGTLYNIVGFQTKMKYAAQKEIFKMIPGLEEAEFARLGGLHRNSYLNSPKLLDPFLRLKSQPHIRFAGQITGVEGYVESAALGLIAGRITAAEALGYEMKIPPSTTAHGGLIHHITGGHILDEHNGVKSFQPMNINFGLLPEFIIPKGSTPRMPRKEKARYKKKCITSRALEDIQDYINFSSR